MYIMQVSQKTNIWYVENTQNVHTVVWHGLQPVRSKISFFFFKELILNVSYRIIREQEIQSRLLKYLFSNALYSFLISSAGTSWYEVPESKLRVACSWKSGKSGLCAFVVLTVTKQFVSVGANIRTLLRWCTVMKCWVGWSVSCWVKIKRLWSRRCN